MFKVIKFHEHGLLFKLEMEKSHSEGLVQSCSGGTTAWLEREE